MPPEVFIEYELTALESAAPPKALNYYFRHF
jgi:hypothetical protein